MHELVALNLGYVGNGQLVQRANEALLKVARDVVERPKVEKPREVTIKIRIWPEVDESTEQNFPRIAYSVGTSVPGHTGVVSQGIVADDGKVYINIAEPKDVLQTSLFATEEMEAKPNVLPWLGAHGKE